MRVAEVVVVWIIVIAKQSVAYIVQQSVVVTDIVEVAVVEAIVEAVSASVAVNEIVGVVKEGILVALEFAFVLTVCVAIASAAVVEVRIVDQLVVVELV